MPNVFDAYNKYGYNCYYKIKIYEVEILNKISKQTNDVVIDFVFHEDFLTLEEESEFDDYFIFKSLEEAINFVYQYNLDLIQKYDKNLKNKPFVKDLINKLTLLLVDKENDFLNAPFIDKDCLIYYENLFNPVTIEEDNLKIGDSIYYFDARKVENLSKDITHYIIIEKEFFLEKTSHYYPLRFVVRYYMREFNTDKTSYMPNHYLNNLELENQYYSNDYSVLKNIKKEKIIEIIKSNLDILNDIKILNF